MCLSAAPTHKQRVIRGCFFFSTCNTLTQIEVGEEVSKTDVILCFCAAQSLREHTADVRLQNMICERHKCIFTAVFYC